MGELIRPAISGYPEQFLALLGVERVCRSLRRRTLKDAMRQPAFSFLKDRSESGWRLTLAVLPNRCK
jgi:hypothetical protein